MNTYMDKDGVTHDPMMYQELQETTLGRPNYSRKLWAVYAVNGELLDIVNNLSKDKPKWFDALTELPTVQVHASEFRRWLDKPLICDFF